MKDVIIFVLSLVFLGIAVFVGFTAYKTEAAKYELQTTCIAAKVAAGIPRKDIILTPTGCTVQAPL